MILSYIKNNLTDFLAYVIIVVGFFMTISLRSEMAQSEDPKEIVFYNLTVTCNYLFKIPVEQSGSKEKDSIVFLNRKIEGKLLYSFQVGKDILYRVDFTSFLLKHGFSLDMQRPIIDLDYEDCNLEELKIKKHTKKGE